MKSKNLLIIVATFVSTLAFAGKETDGLPGNSRRGAAEKIYAALDVKEFSNDIAGASNTIKSIGGLECVRTEIMNLGARASFKCSLDVEDMNAQEIYEALNVAEINIVPPHVLGASRLQKKVATLSCTKSAPVVPRPVFSYSCQLN